MNSNIASFFSLSSLSLSLSSFSSSDISVGISGGEAAVVFEEEVPVGLGVAVDVCDSCFEVEGEREDIECRVTISQEYFSRKTRYWGPGDESFRQESISFLALQCVGRKPERQFSPIIPWMVSRSESERLEDDEVWIVRWQGGHLQPEKRILSRRMRRSSFFIAGWVGTNHPLSS